MILAVDAVTSGKNSPVGAPGAVKGQRQKEMLNTPEECKYHNSTFKFFLWWEGH